MDSVERQAPGASEPLSEEDLVAWDLAWHRVECYLGALGVRNKLVLARKVSEVMDRAEAAWREDRGQIPARLAGRIIDEMVNAWLGEVLAVEGAEPREVSRRGRLAILLLDLPVAWQDAFLSPPPWPGGMAEALRAQYPSTGPDFRRSQMIVRPVDLGAVPHLADRALRGLERVPRLRTTLLWLAVIMGAGALFYFSR